MTTNSDLQQQIDDMQTKLAFQEHTIESLNYALASQQTQITQLERIIKAATEKLNSLEPTNVATASEEPPPPHY